MAAKKTSSKTQKPSGTGGITAYKILVYLLIIANGYVWFFTVYAGFSFPLALFGAAPILFTLCIIDIVFIQSYMRTHSLTRFEKIVLYITLLIVCSPFLFFLV